MKNFTWVLTSLSVLLFATQSYSQKVAVIGINHVTPDGFTFVATENIPNGEVIYFTENEYSNSTNRFIDQTESVVKFTATSGLSKGTVVYVKEISSDIFTVTSSGNTGTAVKTAGSSFFALRTDGESFYAYGDTDEDPTNGVAEIYSALFTGEAAPYNVSGGLIPTELNPVSDFPNAIVIDGFPAVSPGRTEYNTSIADRTNVSKVMLENPANYVNAAANTDLSTTAFTNLNLSGSNPVLTISATPVSVTENSGSGISYTFNLSANAASNITVNFTVGGTATYNTDYTSSGATTFDSTSGTATISAGSNSTSFTLTPVGDANLEPNETIIISISAGSDYDAGSPSSATNTIINDDNKTITPLVAVTGLNHTTSDGFSFVALDNISGGTTIYFTENSFDNSALAFTGSESVLSWTAPAGGILKGDVIVAKETATNTFSLTGNGTSGAASGTLFLLSGSFSLASNGEGFFAYLDSDTNPFNGVDEVHAVLFTGTTTVSGGNIPAVENPAVVYSGMVVVDGFAALAPNRVEYDPLKRNTTVDQADFQNTTNWIYAQPNQDLSPVPFSNIIISSGSANPTATLTLSPLSVVEDDGTSLAYTFSLSEVASSDVTINFTVAGSATYNTDYTVTGAASFSASTGSVVIAGGTSSKVLSVTPIADTEVEIIESVELAISSGTGYDGGSPNDAIGTISNDDTKDSDPLVAITGLNHTTNDGFSFVAAKDIPASSVVYFTDNEFDNTTLLFNSGESVLKWISPGVDIPAGQVMVVSETATNTFTLSRDGTSTDVGTISVVSGDFAIATGGETFYAYEDSDDDPTNGVVDIYAVLFTGAVTSGGNIPPTEDPSGIYLSALVVDGFAASAPDRTEYDPTKRNVLVAAADFENTSNWVHALANQTLSTVPFSNIAIVDIIAPTAVCQNITVYLDAAGSVTVTGAEVDGGSTDNIGISSLSLNPETFTCGNIGTPVNATLTVKDAAGNEDNCTATITVLDTTSPTAVCQDIIVYLDGTGNASITAADVDGGSTDNCAVGTLAADKTTFTCSDIGVNTVTLTVSDVNGNSSSCSSTVTVLDTTSPTAVCQDITVYLDEDGSAVITVADVDGGSSDNCSLGTPSIDINLFTCSDVGPNTVTLTVPDANGNSSSCASTVTVMDTTSPTTVCKDITIYLDGSGAVTLNAADLDGGSTDNCALSSFSVTPATFTCADIGANTVELSVYDAAGNSSTCSSVVTVADTTSPTAVCKDITVYLDANGNASITAADLDGGSTDNCALGTLLIDKTEFTCADIGVHTVTLTVPDVNGNSSSCTSTVTVADITPPQAICKDIDIYLDNNGNASIIPSDINNGSSDNCSLSFLNATPVAFSCSNIGANNVTLAVGDVSGNTSSCTAVVTVHDTIPPTIVCQDPYILSLDASGQADISLKLNEIIVSMTDNCSVFNPTTTVVGVTGPRIYTCANLGVHTVTVFLDDESGNKGSCTFTLTVVDPDSQPPTAICKNIDVMLDATGSASITASDLDNGSSDDCGAVTLSASQTEFSCDDIGANAVVLTVTDAGGLSSTCTATVTVINPNLPSVLCKNIDVYLDENGNASISAADISDGSSGGCGSLTLSASKTDFTCDDVGPNSVTLTVSDVGGNTSSCVATVTVIDNIAPIANCKHKTVSLDSNGEEIIRAEAINNGSWDACGIQSFSLHPDSFSASDIGVNNVVLTVTDNNGNVSTCKSTITVVDNSPPKVSCHSMDFVLATNGQYELTQADIDALAAGTKDNVSAYADLVISVSPMVLTCNDAGESTIMVYASDEAGNIDSCEAKVNIYMVPGVLGLDAIADVFTDEDTPLSIDLSGISSGDACAAQGALLTASNNNPDLVNSLSVNYVSGDTEGTLDIGLMPDKSGTATITVIVENDSGDTVSESFMLTVNPVNDPPVVAKKLEDKEFYADETLDVELSKELGELFDDVDDSLLMYTIRMDGEDLPDWVTVTEDTERINLSFEPLLSDTGCYTIVVDAKDIAGEMAANSFQLCVLPVIVGINDIDKTLFEVSMYPNPTKDWVTIDPGATFTVQEIEISVMNIAGAEVLKQKYHSGDPIRFDLSDEVSGVYLVHIKLDKQRFVKKLILDRK